MVFGYSGGCYGCGFDPCDSVWPRAQNVPTAMAAQSTRAAIGDVHYDTLQAAIDDADSGEEIRLLKNVGRIRRNFQKRGNLHFRSQRKNLEHYGCNQ